MPRKRTSRTMPQGRHPRTSPPEKPLLPVTDQELVATLQRCVHFTGKATNTTVQPVGVRLGGDVRPRPIMGPVPRFVSARGLAADMGGPHALIVDYLFAGASGRDAKIAAQTVTVLTGEHSESSPQLTAQYIEAMRTATAAPATLGADTLDARLRQILVPWGDREASEEYLAGTPLPCAAVGRAVSEALALLARRADMLAEDEKGLPAEGHLRAWQPRHERASFPLGGTKPQNAGVLTRYLVNAWLQPAPSASRELRAAMAIFNGAVHWPSLTGGARLIATAIAEDASGFDIKMRVEGIACWISERVLRAGIEARDTLVRQGFTSPEGEPCISTAATARDLVGPWVAAEGLPRTPAWARAMATETLHRLQAVTCVRAGNVERVIATADVETWGGFVHGALVRSYLGGAS